MSDLVEFLRARLDEDEAIARDAMDEQAGVWTLNKRSDQTHKVVNSLGYSVMEDEDPNSSPWWTTPHIARHDPARVLREVEAKRRILDEVVSLIDGLDADLELIKGTQGYASTGESDLLVKLLALPYADHPDYREEWRP